MNSGLVPFSPWRMTRERAPAPTKVDVAVERVLAGELLRDVDRDIGLTRDEFLAAAQRVAAKPKPKPSRQRKVARRCL